MEEANDAINGGQQSQSEPSYSTLTQMDSQICHDLDSESKLDITPLEKASYDCSDIYIEPTEEHQQTDELLHSNAATNADNYDLSTEPVHQIPPKETDQPAQVDVPEIADSVTVLPENLPEEPQSGIAPEEQSDDRPSCESTEKSPPESNEQDSIPPPNSTIQGSQDNNEHANQAEQESVLPADVSEISSLMGVPDDPSILLEPANRVVDSNDSPSLNQSPIVDEQMASVIDNAVALAGSQGLVPTSTQSDCNLDEAKQVENIQREIIGDREYASPPEPSNTLDASDVQDKSDILRKDIQEATLENLESKLSEQSQDLEPQDESNVKHESEPTPEPIQVRSPESSKSNGQTENQNESPVQIKGEIEIDQDKEKPEKLVSESPIHGSINTSDIPMCGVEEIDEVPDCAKIDDDDLKVVKAETKLEDETVTKVEPDPQLKRDEPDDSMKDEEPKRNKRQPRATKVSAHIDTPARPVRAARIRNSQRASDIQAPKLEEEPEQKHPIKRARISLQRPQPLPQPSKQKQNEVEEKNQDDKSDAISEPESLEEPVVKPQARAPRSRVTIASSQPSSRHNKSIACQRREQQEGQQRYDDKLYRCTYCNFCTNRINNIVDHHKKRCLLIEKMMEVNIEQFKKFVQSPKGNKKRNSR